MVSYFRLFIKNHSFILILLLLSASTHWRWLIYDNFNYGDWVFFFSEGRDHFLSISTWGNAYGSEIGGSSPLTWKLPFNYLYGICLWLGNNSGFADKLLVFFPIIFLLPISSYLLANYIVESKLGAFIGSLIFCFNSYIISLNFEGHLLIPVALSYSVFAILFFIKGLDSVKSKNIILSSIFLTVSLAYDIRVTYITLIVITFYWFARAVLIRKLNINNYIILILCFLLLNMYWILPNIISPLSSNPLMNREIWGSKFLNILNPLTLTHPFWSFDGIEWFIKSRIDWKSFLFPLLFIAGLMVPKISYKIVIFAALSIFGILLSKQIAQPFGSFYIYLFDYIPGFSGFREATKFYFLVLLGYSIIIANLFGYLETINYNSKFRIIKSILLGILGSILILIVMPIQGGYQGGIYSKSLTSAFDIDLNNFLNKELSDGTSRVVFVPKTPNILFSGKNYESYNFSDLINGTFGSNLNGIGETEAGKIFLALNNYKTYDFFINKSIKYLIVSRETINDPVNYYKYYGQSKSAVVDNISHFIKSHYSLAGGGYEIFVLDNVKPIIDLSDTRQAARNFSKNLDWTKITPGLYSIQISDLDQTSILNFRTKFDKNWEIYFIKSNSILSQWNEFYPQKFHSKDSFDNNLFVLDKSYLEKMNQSTDLKFYLVYRPDVYMYAGIVISIFSLMIFFTILLFHRKK